MTFAYLAALVVALTGMVLLDRRFRLFFWRDSRRAAIVLVVGVLFFLAWDFAGVGLGIFFRGVTPFMTGWQIAREIPVEEVFFLTLLCYLTMNVYGALEPRAKAGFGLRRDASADGSPRRRSRGAAS
jgi:lycopene cyclase domain-containing protein